MAPSKFLGWILTAVAAAPPARVGLLRWPAPAFPLTGTELSPISSQVTAPPSPATQHDPSVSGTTAFFKQLDLLHARVNPFRLAQPCWLPCSRDPSSSGGEGRCDSFCGEGGLCCRLGWGHSNTACRGVMGEADKHVCVVGPGRYDDGMLDGGAVLKTVLSRAELWNALADGRTPQTGKVWSRGIRFVTLANGRRVLKPWRMGERGRATGGGGGALAWVADVEAGDEVPGWMLDRAGGNGLLELNRFVPKTGAIAGSLASNFGDYVVARRALRDGRVGSERGTRFDVGGMQVQPATQSVSGNEVRLFGPASFVSASADRADVHADRADVLVCGQCRWKTLQRGDQLPGNAICGVFDYANHQCLAFVGRNYWRQPSCDGNQGELGAAYTSDDPFAGVSAEPFQKPLDMCAGGERHLEVGGPGEDEATRAGANGFFKVRSPHRHFWKYNSGAAGWMLGWKSGGGHEYQVYVYEEMGLSERRFQGDDGVFDSEGTAGLSETSFLLKPPAEAPQAYSTDKFFTQLDDLRKKTENLLADSTTLSTKLDGVRELLGEYEQQRGNMTVKREELKLLRGAEQAREERASHAASFEELDVWLRSWRRGNEDRTTDSEYAENVTAGALLDSEYEYLQDFAKALSSEPDAKNGTYPLFPEPLHRLKFHVGKALRIIDTALGGGGTGTVGRNRNPPPTLEMRARSILFEGKDQGPGDGEPISIPRFFRMRALQVHPDRIVGGDLTESSLHALQALFKSSPSDVWDVEKDPIVVKVPDTPQEVPELLGSRPGVSGGSSSVPGSPDASSVGIPREVSDVEAWGPHPHAACSADTYAAPQSPFPLLRDLGEEARALLRDLADETARQRADIFRALEGGPLRKLFAAAYTHVAWAREYLDAVRVGWAGSADRPAQPFCRGGWEGEEEQRRVWKRFGRVLKLVEVEVELWRRRRAEEETGDASIPFRGSLEEVEQLRRERRAAARKVGLDREYKFRAVGPVTFSPLQLMSGKTPSAAGPRPFSHRNGRKGTIVQVVSASANKHTGDDEPENKIHPFRFQLPDGEVYLTVQPHYATVEDPAAFAQYHVGSQDQIIRGDADGELDPPFQDIGKELQEMQKELHENPGWGVILVHADSLE